MALASRRGYRGGVICPLFVLVPLLAACPGSPTTTDTGKVDTGTTDPPAGRDTGTAFVSWHGTLSYDPVEESLVATRGIGAQTLLDDAYVCDITAAFESVSYGAEGCPDCEYSFTTQMIGGGQVGEGCKRFTVPTLFDYFDYTDFYFGQYLDGFGWSNAYTYTYAAVDYELTNVVWGHINGLRYNGWYLYGYNLPASAAVHVFGDKYAASFSRPVLTKQNTLTYYYFYY